ncbi:MAG: hypothetical protein KDH09_15550, partial [Chrysiogenetes bacterium]|nr:hypothetical protein [Chrysiogenetes bacterium]
MYTLETDDRIKLAWLLRLRWGAVAGQLALVLGVYAAGVSLPLAALLSLIAFTAATNTATALLASDEDRALPQWTIGALLALDTLALTGLLYWSGGPSNPFSALYLVHVTLAAVALGPRWTWALVALASVGFGFLFYANVPIPGAGDPHAHHHAMGEPAQGFS